MEPLGVCHTLASWAMAAKSTGEFSTSQKKKKKYSVYHEIARILLLSPDMLSSCLKKIIQLTNLTKLILIKSKKRKVNFLKIASLLIGSSMFKTGGTTDGF